MQGPQWYGLGLLYCSIEKEVLEEKAMVVAAVWGTKFIQLQATLKILHQDDLKNRMNRRTDTWRNGCFGKIDDHLVHTPPKHRSPKMDDIPRTFLQIILAAKWLVRQSKSPPNSSDDLCLSFCLILLLCIAVMHTGG